MDNCEKFDQMERLITKLSIKEDQNSKAIALLNEQMRKISDAIKEFLMELEE